MRVVRQRNGSNAIASQSVEPDVAAHYRAPLSHVWWLQCNPRFHRQPGVLPQEVMEYSERLENRHGRPRASARAHTGAGRLEWLRVSLYDWDRDATATRRLV